MKREFLKELGLTDEQIDKIMGENGKDIEAQKAKTLIADEASKAVLKQLEEANAQIEGFKAMKIEDVQKAAAEWEGKARAAEEAAGAQVKQLKFDHALDAALIAAKARNPKAVRALLDLEQLSKGFNETDSSFSALETQLKEIRDSNGFLFEDNTPTPKIVTGGQNKSVLSDPVILAARRAAGLSNE